MLAFKSMQAAKFNYKVVPKFHVLGDFLIKYVQSTGRNPRFDHCYSDESLVGLLGTIASATHVNRLHDRVLTRYAAMLDVSYRIKQAVRAN